MTRVSITDSYSAVEADLWGDVFDLKPLTKGLEADIQKREAKLDAKLEKVEDYSALVDLMAEILDLRLVAQEGQRKASTVVKAKWKSGELNFWQLVNYTRDLSEAETQQRPT